MSETVREHFNGHCCADDPECEHSFLDDIWLARHLDSTYHERPDRLYDEHSGGAWRSSGSGGWA